MKKFTLVEILVSIAIIAILFGMAIGVTSYVKTKIARSSTQTTMKLIEMAFQKYKNDFGMYPYAANGTDPGVLSLPAVDFESSSTDFKANLWGYFNDVTADSSNPKIRGIRLSGSGPFYILDGWGHHIIYICPGVFNPESFDLISGGADGQLDQTTSIKTTTSSPTFGENPRGTIGNWNVENLGDDITNFSKQ